ncbi:MAG: efflux RND transporter periplasmic adaptor subunit [Ignavibacteria bacterium]
MKKLFLLMVSLLLIGSSFSCGRKSGSENKSSLQQLSAVRVVEVKPQHFVETYRVIGIVKPYESAKLSSEEGGIITYLAKDKGDKVRKGEVLVRLKKDTDQKAYEQALAQYNLAKENFERIERLYNENVATEQQYTNSKLQLDIAIKAVELYRTRLSKGYIVSPINGVVDAKFLNKGEMSSPGAPILSIVDVSRVKINAGIPEKYVGEITRGQNVLITFEVLPDEKFYGVVGYTSPTIDPQSRTFEVEVILNNKDRKLKPEMSATLEFTRLDINDAVVIGQDQFVDNGEEKYVFVLENDIAKKRIIRIGGFSDSKVYVESGLNLGEKLIIEGFRGLNDNEKVQVVN